MVRIHQTQGHSPEKTVILSLKALGEYVFNNISQTHYIPGAGCPRMATPEPLPQRPMRKWRRLRGQQPLSSEPDLTRVVGSVAMPPFGGPCTATLPLLTKTFVSHCIAIYIDANVLCKKIRSTMALGNLQKNKENMNTQRS